MEEAKMSFGVQKDNPTVVRNNKPITVLSAVRKGYEQLLAITNNWLPSG